MSGGVAGPFKYNERRGEIVLAERLDREQICVPSAPECAITLHVLFKMEQQNNNELGNVVNIGQRLLTLTIVTADVNDLPPEFQIPFSWLTRRLCQTSLDNSMSGDVFLATDNDKSK